MTHSSHDSGPLRVLCVGPPKANASISYKSGTGFLEKPGGSINLVFKAKPTASGNSNSAHVRQRF